MTPSIFMRRNYRRLPGGASAGGFRCLEATDERPAHLTSHRERDIIRAIATTLLRFAAIVDLVLPNAVNDVPRRRLFPVSQTIATEAIRRHRCEESPHQLNQRTPHSLLVSHP